MGKDDKSQPSTNLVGVVVGPVSGAIAIVELKQLAERRKRACNDAQAALNVGSDDDGAQVDYHTLVHCQKLIVTKGVSYT